MTEWVLAALKAECEHQKATWVEVSWDGGQADPATLIALRAKASALYETANLKYEGLCEIHGHDPIID